MVGSKVVVAWVSTGMWPANRQDVHINFIQRRGTNESSSLTVSRMAANRTNETLAGQRRAGLLCGCCLLIVHVNLIKLINSRCAMRQPQVKQLTAAGHCPDRIQQSHMIYDTTWQMANNACIQKPFSFKRKCRPQQSHNTKDHAADNNNAGNW